MKVRSRSSYYKKGIILSLIFIIFIATFIAVTPFSYAAENMWNKAYERYNKSKQNNITQTKPATKTTQTQKTTIVSEQNQPASNNTSAVQPSIPPQPEPTATVAVVS